MNELAKYEVYKKKLDGLCDEHGLVANFKSTDYPIALSVTPNMGVGEQLSILANAEDGRVLATEARLRFTMKDGDVAYEVTGGINVSDALLTKMKNLFVNMTRCWQGHFFREVVSRNLIQAERLPTPATSTALPEDAEPIEDYEPELDDDMFNGGDDLGEMPDVEDVEVEAFTEPDPLYDKAVAAVREAGSASLSHLQRALKIGHARAELLMEAMEKAGVVGPYNGAAPREVLGMVKTQAVDGDGE